MVSPGITLLSDALTLSLPSVGSNGYLGDIASHSSGTLTAGVYEQKPSTEEAPLKFKYKYDEFKLVIEGTICIKEVATGTKIEAKKGDVVKIEKGADLEFWSPEGGKAYFVGNRGEGEL